MKESLVSDRHPVMSLFFILLTVGIGFLFIGPVLGLAVASVFYEGNLLRDFTNPEPDASLFLPMMITQGIASLMGLIVLPMLYIRFGEHKSWTPFFTSESDWLKTLAMIIGIGLCFLVAISPVVEWNMNFQFPEAMQAFGDWARTQEDKLAKMTEFLTSFETPEKFLLAFVVIAILPGIGEELVFRGLIQNELWRGGKNIHVAIWLSAFLFSAIHMQFFGFVPRMLLGALFGYLYYWSGNLAVPMFAHFFHNGFTVTMLYLYNIDVIDMNIDSEESAPVTLVALCAVLTFTLLYFFRKQYSQQPS